MGTAGIITTFRQPNWGSVLQAYALQTAVTNLGYKCEIIDYIYPNDFHLNKGLKPFSSPVRLKTKLAIALGLRSKNKMQMLNDFIRDNMIVSKPYDYNSIHTNPPQYDIYISGSDQIWNPNTMLGDYTYFFDFAGENASKISYSSSFSCNKIPKDFVNDYKNLLSEYNSLSVREANGVAIIKDLINRDATLVLDPTLLLTKDHWINLADKANPKLKLPTNYILVYMLGYTYNPRESMKKIVSRVQKETGYPVIVFDNLELNLSENIWKIPKNIGIGIHEFLKLISNASVIVTSSFHGTAFSILFEKKFISLVDGKNSDDRIKTLLNQVGLGNNMLQSPDIENQDIKINNYDIPTTRNRLNKARLESLNFLTNAIKRSVEELNHQK